jgi:hypothetical protein
MEEDKFCQLFLYSLINLVCFLLTTIFLTTIYNIKSQLILLHLSKSLQTSYNNSYSAIAALFTFEFLGFFVFMIIIMVLIKKIKVNKVEFNRFRINKNVNIAQNQNQNDINTDERLEAKNNININNNYTINENNDDNENSTISNLEKATLALFIYCQIIYLIEVIVLTAYFTKSKDLEKEFIKEEDGEYFTKRYRDLMIVGYIFLFIFILFDLFTILIITKCGINPETEEERREQENQKRRYCEFCSKCIAEACYNMAKKFRNCIKTKEEINKEIQDLEKKSEELEIYRQKLEIINNKLKENRRVTGDDLEELHLPSYEVGRTRVTPYESIT